MTRRWFRIVCACSFAALAATASADPINVGDTVRFADGPGTTGGGEFLATVNTLDQLITFCLQRTEYIDYSTAFVVGGVNTYAMTDAAAQGGAPVTGQDPISSQTAWLYTQFRANALAGYAYLGAGRVQSANDLQNAIWWFEHEIAANPNNAFVTAANQAVAGGWSGIGDVRVINLYFPDGREAQDQLMLVDSARRQVPEPTALLLLGAGVATAAWRRRNRRPMAKM